MCGVHAIVLMPSDDATQAIANDISRSFEPSSIPGSRWQCRSINLSSCDFSSAVTAGDDDGQPMRAANPTAPRAAVLCHQCQLGKFRRTDAFDQQSLGVGT